MTHAEAMVYAAAFGASIVAQSSAVGPRGIDNEGRSRVAARHAWAAVRALRECPPVAEDGGPLDSLTMLAEFRAFGSKPEESR